MKAAACIDMNDRKVEGAGGGAWNVRSTDIAAKSRLKSGEGARGRRGGRAGDRKE